MPPCAAVFKLQFTFSLLPFTLYCACEHLAGLHAGAKGLALSAQTPGSYLGPSGRVGGMGTGSTAPDGPAPTPLHSGWVTRPHHAAPLGQRPDPTMAWDPGAVSLPAFDPHLGNSTGSVSLLGSKHRGQGLRGRPALWAGSCCSSWARLSSQELEFRTPRGYAALTLLGRGHLK